MKATVAVFYEGELRRVPYTRSDYASLLRSLDAVGVKCQQFKSKTCYYHCNDLVVFGNDLELALLESIGPKCIYICSHQNREAVLRHAEWRQFPSGEEAQEAKVRQLLRKCKAELELELIGLGSQTVSGQLVDLQELDRAAASELTAVKQELHNFKQTLQTKLQQIQPQLDQANY